MVFKRKLKKHPTKKLIEQNKQEYETKKSNPANSGTRIMTLEQFKEKHYGKPGTAKREELEAGYENFKIGAYFTKPDFKKA